MVLAVVNLVGFYDTLEYTLSLDGVTVELQQQSLVVVYAKMSWMFSGKVCLNVFTMCV